MALRLGDLKKYQEKSNRGRVCRSVPRGLATSRMTREQGVVPAWNPQWKAGDPKGRTKELAAIQNAVKLKVLSGAGVEILNRGLGLPAAQVDVDVPVRRQISTMSIGELRALEEKLTALPPEPPGNQKTGPVILKNVMLRMQQSLHNF